jgi:hypothetical protein
MSTDISGRSPETQCLGGGSDRALPDDVLTLVSAYSKPLLRHSKAYKEAMFALGVTEMFDVKALLYTEKADKAIEALTGYAAAMVAIKEAEISMWDINIHNYPDLDERMKEWIRNTKLLFSSKRLRDKYCRRIGRLIVGKEYDEEPEEPDVEEGEEDYEELNYLDHEDD